MGNNSVPKFIFRLSRFTVYRGSVLGMFYCISFSTESEIIKTETAVSTLRFTHVSSCTK